MMVPSCRMLCCTWPRLSHKCRLKKSLSHNGHQTRHTVHMTYMLPVGLIKMMHDCILP